MSALEMAMGNVLDVLRTMPAMMTVKQAVEVLNTDADESARWSERSYYYHAQRGEVPVRKVGGRVLVPKAELAAWLGIRAQDVEPGPESAAPEPREPERRVTARRVPRRYLRVPRRLAR